MIFEFLFDLTQLIWVILSAIIQLAANAWVIYCVYKIGIKGYTLRFHKLGNKTEASE